MCGDLWSLVVGGPGHGNRLIGIEDVRRREQVQLVGLCDHLDFQTEAHVVRSHPQMTFRRLNQKYLAPGAQSLMIFGIISLCQPWSLFLHQNGLMLTLIGLIAFIVTSKIAPEPEVVEENDEDIV